MAGRTVSTSRTLRWLCLVALILVGTFAATAFSPNRPAIGFMGCFGSAFINTTSSRDGALAAIEEYNRSRGPHTPEVRLIVRDARSGPGEMVQDLAAEGVTAIVGPTCIHCLESASKAAMSQRILLLTPTLGVPRQLADNSTLLSIYPQTERRFDFMARHLLSRHQAKHVAVFVNERSAPLGEQFKASFQHAGGSRCIVYDVDNAEQDGVRGISAAIANSAPDAVLLLGPPVDGALLTQHLRRRAFPGLIATDEFLANRDFLAYGGQAAEGVLVFGSFRTDHPSDRFRDFSEAFTRRFGYEPDAAAIHTYDATRIILTTMAEADDQREMMPMLLAKQSFDGLYEKISVQAGGETRREIIPVVIKQGGFAAEK